MMFTDERVGPTFMEKMDVLMRSFFAARVKHLIVNSTGFLSLVGGVWLAVFVSVPARHKALRQRAPAARLCVARPRRLRQCIRDRIIYR